MYRIIGNFSPMFGIRVVLNHKISYVQDWYKYIMDYDGKFIFPSTPYREENTSEPLPVEDLKIVSTNEIYASMQRKIKIT